MALGCNSTDINIWEQIWDNSWDNFFNYHLVLGEILGQKKCLLNCTPGLRGRRAGDAAVSPAPSAGVAPSAAVEKVRDEVDGQREDDGRVLLGRDRVQRL